MAYAASLGICGAAGSVSLPPEHVNLDLFPTLLYYSNFDLLTFLFLAWVSEMLFFL